MRRDFSCFVCSAFIVLFLTVFPYSAKASHSSSPTQAELLTQISLLLEQIQALQELLNALKAETDTPKLSTDTEEEEFEIRETHYFGTDFEAIYEVDERLALTRRDRATGVRISDLKLWDLFIDTIGRTETKQYIDELRVFDSATSDIAAFVELRRSSKTGDYWILGVNEDGFDTTDDAIRRSYTVTFIHEFAHILAADPAIEPTFDEFVDIFWDSNDIAHAKSTEDLDGQALDDALEDYYKDNEDEFISDYATYNPDEDWAETFTYFVINDQPNSTEDWADKVDFFFDDARLTEARYNIRENLDL